MKKASLSQFPLVLALAARPGFPRWSRSRRARTHRGDLRRRCSKSAWTTCLLVRYGSTTTPTPVVGDVETSSLEATYVGGITPPVLPESDNLSLAANLQVFSVVLPTIRRRHGHEQRPWLLAS